MKNMRIFRAVGLRGKQAGDFRWDRKKRMDFPRAETYSHI